MTLDKEILMKKSINDLIELCLKLNNDNENLRTKVEKLQKGMPTDKMKEKYKQMQADYKKYKTLIDKIKVVE